MGELFRTYRQVLRAKPGPESTPPRNSLPGGCPQNPIWSREGPNQAGDPGHGPMCPGPFLLKPMAYGPRTLPGQAKPLWALIGNWHRNEVDRDRHMDRDRHWPCIQFLELVPNGKWARAQTGLGPNGPGSNGPGPKRARAQMGTGPNGPGPHGPGPEQKSKNIFFCSMSGDDPEEARGLDLE